MSAQYLYLDREAFLKTYGEVYENTDWIVKLAFDSDSVPDFLDVPERATSPKPQTENEARSIAKVFATTLETGNDKQKLALIRAHPDLVGRAAIAGELGDDSTLEQASAGLDQCTPDEFNRFQEANSLYRKKFDFPFVMAVRGADRNTILLQFEQRLQNDIKAEFATALLEINKIALLRIIAKIEPG